LRRRRRSGRAALFGHEARTSTGSIFFSKAWIETGLRRGVLRHGPAHVPGTEYLPEHLVPADLGRPDLRGRGT
jgi:hypothetical protein